MTISRRSIVLLKRPVRLQEGVPPIPAGTLGVVTGVSLDGKDADVDCTIEVHHRGWGHKHYHVQATVDVADLEVIQE